MIGVRWKQEEAAWKEPQGSLGWREEEMAS